MGILTNNRIYDEKNAIREVKAGETGYGLLIERDGHILGNDDMIKQIHEDIAHNDRFTIPDHFIVSAVFQKFGVKNANGRIYPEAILKHAVDKYINERVNNHCAIGALDHPQSSTLSGHDVTHNILNLEWEGKTLIGEMELHLSPGYRRYGVCSTSGDLVANMLLDNILIGVSSRALGSVEERFGKIIVGDDLDLISWDVVCEPSTPNAFIKMSRSELQPFIESTEKEDDKMIAEKINKLNQMLLS